MDGAPIARTRLWCSEASRTHWLPDGKLRAKPSLVNAIREILRWVKEDPSACKLRLITLKPIRLALDAILHPDDPVIADAWRKVSQLDSTINELRREVGPILVGWDGEILLGHFGAVRGLDSMKDVDCLVTLGDPWPNVGQVRRDMDYLDMSDDGDARMEALCRAELEQAHGRLRTIHRTRPGRALHVGKVPPGGLGWCGGKVEHRQRKKGRPGAAEPMSIEELEAIIAACGGASGRGRSGRLQPQLPPEVPER